MGDKGKLDKAIMAAEAELASTRQRLAEVQGELAAINADAAPTTDLAAEEAAALKRLARTEALRRVARGLEAERDRATAQIAQLKEELREVEAARLKAEIEAAQKAARDAIWDAYEAARQWEDKAQELNALKPFAWADDASRTTREALQTLAVKVGAANILNGPAGVQVSYKG